MDPAPDPKRQRMASASDTSWTNNGQTHQRAILPPVNTAPGPPPSHTYNPPPPPYPRPGSGPPGTQHHIPIDDRRQHEQEYSIPLHDPQRVMSGAPNTYGQYPPPPRGDAAFKRDPSTEPNPLHNPRPNSTGHSTDPHVVPHPADDPRRQSMGYDGMQGGPPAHQPQQAYRGPGPYGPPPAPLQTQVHEYVQPAAYAPQTPIYTNSYQQSPMTQARRKAPRTSQACGQCRTAKAKCDDPKPCSACRKANVVCDFKPPEPKQADKVQQEILEHLTKISDQVYKMDSRMSKMERNLTRGDYKVDYKIEPDHEGRLEEDGNQESMKEENEEYLEVSPSANHDAQQESYQLNYQSLEAPDSLPQDDDEDIESKFVFPANKPSIPENHTTPAARMLGWESVWKYVGDFITKNKDIKNYHYTMTREVKRGTLRPYGRGEAAENQQVLEKEPMPDQTSEVMDDDESSEASASPAADYLWGQSGSFTPPAAIQIIKPNPDDRRGGLDSTNSNLELDPATIERLSASYMKHINCMHPIIYPELLKRLTKNFLRSIPESTSGKKESNASFVVSGAAGSKRKREEFDSPPTQHLKPGRPQRSIDNALLLVILALGKVCEYKGRIPPPVPDNGSDMSASGSRNGHPSPSNFSPAISPQSSLASPKDGERNRDHGVRRNSLESNLPKDIRRPVPVPLRNLDVIPGLAYWAAASDIIGNTLGGTSLRHVQVNILASLYFGQLARVQESHTFLTVAGRAMQIILLGRSERYKKLAEENKMGKDKDAQILLAFWSCLQLESDILAELDFPQSGLLKWENEMPWPDGASIREQGTASYIVNSYMSQLFTRKHMNSIHEGLYNASSEKDYKLPLDSKVQKELLDRIKNSERLLGNVSGTIRSNPDDLEPPDEYIADILRERIQAKKNGALNITYRPCLMMVMNRPEGYPFSQIPNDIRHHAMLCLMAMENSTAAFPMKNNERVIITNPWGTAHAQWGNAIALQAAYMDPDLKGHIDREKLTKLVSKTLDFLRSFAQPSSSLTQDIRILEYMATEVTKILPPSRNYSTASAPMVGSGSFNSNGSMETSPP